MSFITIPDTTSMPYLVNIDIIKYVKPVQSTREDGTVFETMEINFTDGSTLSTSLPRFHLVDILMKKDKEQKTVRTVDELVV